MPASSATSIHFKTPDAIGRRLEASVIVLPVFLLGFLLARFAAPIFMLLPACTFRAAFGFPCPSCGMTRAGLALAQGELLTAFAYNPLLVMSVGILSLWSAGQWLEILRRKNSIAVLSSAAQRKLLRVYSRNGIFRELNPVQSEKWRRWLVISAIGLNWLYLIIAG